MRVTPDVLLNAVSMSQSQSSSSQQLNQMFAFSVQAVFTGSPVGTAKLQASLDGTTWTDIEDSSDEIAAAGNILWNVADVGYPYMRFVYTRTSGSGALTVKFFGRGF